MDELALNVRSARPEDAADLARIYIESWQDTYPGIISSSLLGAMSFKGHAQRWRDMIRGANRRNGAVLVAEDARHGTIGLSSLGPARDGGAGFDGEVYTLYVDPAFLGRGAGSALMAGAFAAFKERDLHSCLIWAHARNNACFFYEAMGGIRSGNRQIMMGGQDVHEVAFGWKQLALSRRKLTT